MYLCKFMNMIKVHCVHIYKCCNLPGLTKFVTMVEVRRLQ